MDKIKMCCNCKKTAAHVIHEKRYYCASCRFQIQTGQMRDGGLTQTRTGTGKTHTILSRDCLPISA